MSGLFNLLVFLLVIAYGVLVFSSYGIVFSETKEKGELRDTLKCRYFTGISVMEKEYWYSANDLLGRSVCPRTIYFGED